MAEQKYNDDLLYLKRLQFSKIKSHNKETEEMNEKHIDILNEAKHDVSYLILIISFKNSFINVIIFTINWIYYFLYLDKRYIFYSQLASKRDQMHSTKSMVKSHLS